MNSSLLDRIERTDNAILVTVLATEGHTYKKPGDKSLYQLNNAHPVWGNLGTTCVDPHILEEAARARSEGKPARIDIDTSDPADAHLGTGTFCGGRITLLVEPILDRHKDTYRRIRADLDAGKAVIVVHDMRTGDLDIVDSAPERRPDLYVETLTPPERLYIFGATPLTRRLIRILEPLDFTIHVSDWREGYLDNLRDLPRVTFHQSQWPVDASAFALVMSHHHDRDLDSLRSALSARCRFVGLLSSVSRRDHILVQLKEEGVPEEQLARIYSPVGIDINSRTDAEIATSIAAQLIKVKNQ